MESSKSGGSQAPFMQQILHNKILMLTVLLAAGAAAYFGIGLFLLLSH